MERLVFGGLRPVHPGAHPGLAARTITVGSASKELRMIGWRVGWVTGPAPIMKDIGLVGLTNVVCQVGIAQQGVAAALRHAGAAADVAAATAIWERRCQHILDQLTAYPCVRPDGGWSLRLVFAKEPVDASATCGPASTPRWREPVLGAGTTARSA